MRDRLRDRWHAVATRIRRIERREIRELRAWIERTSNLVRLSAVVFVPLLVALVTYLSNSLAALSFLLFPPLASGAYTLFSNPRGRYASPTRFVVGLTAGAACGWAALVISTAVGVAPAAGPLRVSVLGAGLAVFLAGVVTWAFDVEEPAAYATALLGLLVPAGRQPAFVLSVLFSTVLVSLVFLVWRREFYEQRASILYQSTSGDDHVLVPMGGAHAHATAMLGARLAAAHDAGKVVLLDVVEDTAVAEAERELLDRNRDVELATGAAVTTEQVPTTADTIAEDCSSAAPDSAAAETVRALEDRASTIRDAVGVPCEVVVAVDGEDRAATILETARATNCDLVAVPFAERRGSVAPFIRDLFAGDVDVLVHRSTDGRTDWRRVMVPVRRTGQVAHSMVDFALRLVGDDGGVSVCHCISGSGSLRRAEDMLADLVGPFEGRIETRISRADIQSFLSRHDDEYDLVFVGASRDRSAASRVFSPPTFERLEDVDADVAVVDRG